MASLRLVESARQAATDPDDKPPCEYGAQPPSCVGGDVDPFAQNPDAGSAPPCSSAAGNVGTSTEPRCVFKSSVVWVDPFTTCAAGACVSVSMNAVTSLTFLRPSAPGTFRLEDLGSTLCDADCSAVSGSLVVAAVQLPCGAAACGRFEAELTLRATSSSTRADGPTLSGSAQLRYTEVQSECGDKLPPFGLDFDRQSLEL
jgi:hypothetical protein